MTETEILQGLSALIAREHKLDVSTISLQKSLNDLGLDSLAVAELLFSIEEHLHVNLEEIEPQHAPATVGDLVALIYAKQRLKPLAA